MRYATPFPVEVLREMVAYLPETGRFLYLKSGVATHGWRSRGRMYITVKNKKIAAHRAAWAIRTGRWPMHPIDHRDGDWQNNKWENLRKASQSQNAANKAIQKNNTSGFKGVTWSKAHNKWRAKIKAEGKHIHLGLFVEVTAAHDAYVSAAKQYYGEFARSI